MELKRGIENVDLNHLFYFSHVVTAGSIKGAAEHLGLSPSTLSEQVAQLENSLGTLLFTRQHRKLLLTNDGTRVFQYSKHLLDTAAKIRESLSDKSQVCYPSNVGIVQCLSICTSYKVIAHYVKHSGLVKMGCFDVNHEELENGIIRGRFDFGFSNRSSTRKDIEHCLVSSSKIKYFVASHLGARKVEDLIKDLPLLLCANENGTAVPHEFKELHEREPIAIVASDSPFILEKLCVGGMGIGQFTDDFIAEFFKVGAVVEIEVPGHREEMNHVYALWPRGAEKSGAVKNLIRCLELLAPKSPADS